MRNSMQSFRRFARRKHSRWFEAQAKEKDWKLGEGCASGTILRLEDAAEHYSVVCSVPADAVKLRSIAVQRNWEDQARQYENRRKAHGSRPTLDADIKISILESICPVEVERHLQLNQARFADYQEVRKDLSTYLETRIARQFLCRYRRSPTNGHWSLWE
jgi:hypothetical protein